MKHKRSRWIFLLALPLVLLLASCGNKQAASDSSSNGPIKIQVWTAMTGKPADQFQQIVDDYNKSQKKYKVVATSQGNYNQLNQKIMAAAKSNTLPALAQLSYVNTPDLVKNQLLQPLDSFINGKNGLSEAELNNIYPSFRTSMQYKGKYYTVPFNKAPRVLFYNKNLLNKYGLSVPQTWDDVVNDAKKVKNDGIVGLGFDKNCDIGFTGIVQEFGNPLISQNLRVNFDTPTTEKAMNFFVDNIKNGYMETAGSDIYYYKKFLNGKSLFYFGSSSNIPNITANAPQGFEWGTAAVPSQNGKRVSAIGGADLMMMKNISKEQQDGAWDFMKYVISPKVTAKWSELSGYVPVNKAAVNLSDFQAYLNKNPYEKAAVDALNYGSQPVAFQNYASYQQSYLNGLTQMLTLQKSPSQVLPELQKDAQQAVKGQQQ